MVTQTQAKVILITMTLWFTLFSSYYLFYYIKLNLYFHDQTFQAPAAEQYLIQNLQSSPIQHISIINSSDKCSKGNIATLTMPLFQKEDKNYAFFQRIEQMTVQNWGNKQICIEHNKNPQYLASSSLECQSDYKKCGSNLCIQKDEDCPITDIEFNNHQAKFSISDDPSEEQNKLTLTRYGDPGSSIYYFTELTISLTEEQCFINIDKSISPVDSIENYKNLYRRTCMFYGDDKRALILAKLSGLKLSQSNNKLENNQDINHKYYDTLYDETIYLSLRKRAIPLKDSCVPNYPLPSLDYSHLFLAPNHPLYVTLIIFYGLSIFAFPVIYCITCCEQENYQRSLREMSWGVSYNLFIQCFTLLYTMIIYFVDLANFKNGLNYLEENKILTEQSKVCSNFHPFFQVQHDLQNFYEEVYNKLGFINILPLISIVLLLISFIIYKSSPDFNCCVKTKILCKKICQLPRRHQVLNQSESNSDDIEMQ